MRQWGGRDTARDDLADSGVESIQRDSSGAIVHTAVGSTATTGVTGSTTLSQTAAARQFASAASISVTEGGAGTVTLTLSRNGAAVFTSSSITTTTTLTTQNTFTASSVTWSLAISVSAGTWSVSSWTQSVEASRG